MPTENVLCEHMVRVVGDDWNDRHPNHLHTLLRRFAVQGILPPTVSRSSFYFGFFDFSCATCCQLSASRAA